MLKRSLCFLLAVVTLFALAAPAFAAAPTSGACGDNVKWSLSGGTLTISGTGPMWDFGLAYGESEALWFVHPSSIKKAVIGNGVTSIGDIAFSGCTSLTSVTIPASVTNIGKEAFQFLRELAGCLLRRVQGAVGRPSDQDG